MVRRAIVLLFAVCCAALAAQENPAAKPSVRYSSRVLDPAELSGPPKAMPPPPTLAKKRLVESATVEAFDPEKPETIAAALQAINAILKGESDSDVYLIRALIGCYGKIDPKSILGDINMSMSTHTSSSTYKTKRDHYALKAKIEFANGQLQSALDDLDNAIKEGYEDAPQMFNDGGAAPSTTAKPCVWTQADFSELAKRFPTDYRPPLYLGLYLTAFTIFDVKTDFKPILTAFERSASLNPASPLPHYYVGAAYTTGTLGGIMSMANTKCLDYIVPRTEPCLQLDELHRTGIRSLTKAIAQASNFLPAYALRALALYRLKKYRQAIRDYDKALELRRSEGTRGLYNDRGLAKLELNDYRGAISDFTTAIARGCDETCGSFENRALAYSKVRDYSKAIADYTAEIKHRLGNDVFLMNIDQFRRIYPEYDSMADDAIAEKVRALFFPEMARDVFAKQFLIESKEWDGFLLPELYLKRGDAYAKLGDFKKANLEYDRVSMGFPGWAKTAFTERNGKRIRNPE